MEFATGSFWSSFVLPLICIGMGFLSGWLLRSGAFFKKRFEPSVDLEEYFTPKVIAPGCDIQKMVESKPVDRLSVADWPHKAVRAENGHYVLYQDFDKVKTRYSQLCGLAQQVVVEYVVCVETLAQIRDISHVNPTTWAQLLRSAVSLRALAAFLGREVEPKGQ